jgi:uridine nucleosidase
MIPINVTHTAIATSAIQSRLLSPSGGLRHTLSTLITYFADSYKSTFGFEDGPPLHDPLTVAFVSRPDLFSCQRYRVDVELGGTHTAGETVVDIWDYCSCDESWGPLGKNCFVAKSVDVITPLSLLYYKCYSSPCDQVDGFFELFFRCVEKCDKVSPLNH